MITFGGDGYKGAYAKVWKLDPHDKYVKASVSTSRKVGEEYENSSWNVTFLGNCVERAKEISVGDKIILKAGSFSNIKSKSDGKYYVNVAVFAFDFPDYAQNNNDKPVARKQKESVPEPSSDGFYTLNEDDEDLPF